MNGFVHDINHGHGNQIEHDLFIPPPIDPAVGPMSADDSMTKVTLETNIQQPLKRVLALRKYRMGCFFPFSDRV